MQLFKKTKKQKNADANAKKIQMQRNNKKNFKKIKSNKKVQK